MVLLVLPVAHSPPLLALDYELGLGGVSPVFSARPTENRASTMWNWWAWGEEEVVAQRLLAHCSY